MEKDRVLVFGLGGMWEKNEVEIKSKYNVILYTDNNISKHLHKNYDRKFILPNDISLYEFDKIIVCSSYIEEIRNQLVNEIGVDERKIIDYAKCNLLQNSRTSVSDNGSYPEFCFLASIKTSYFKNFRNNSVYTQVLEHVTKEQGKQYLDYIKNNSPHLLDKIGIFKENDKIGNPLVYDYDEIDKISPTTLRYIKVLSDLEEKFGDLDGKEICEIGVGYGGQCRILCAYFNIKSYTLIDLPQVLSLAKNYLNNYCLNTKLNYVTMNELDKDKRYDLFLSNYAFSELKKDIQECYFGKTIANSKNGYITYNNLGGNILEQFSLTDYKEKILNAVINEEEPKTFEGNKIIVW